jgi:DNA-binding transcriptional MocR family regulator
MRLNFSYTNPEQIREGIRRLSIAIKAQMKELGILPELVVTH